MGIETYIPFGRENAITRKELCSLTKLSDRKLREQIEQAQDGRGISSSITDGGATIAPMIRTRLPVSTVSRGGGRCQSWHNRST